MKRGFHCHIEKEKLMTGLRSLNGLIINDTVYSRYGKWYGRVTYIDERQFQVYTPSDKTERVFIWSDLIRGFISKVE